MEDTALVGRGTPAELSKLLLPSVQAGRPPWCIVSTRPMVTFKLIQKTLKSMGK